MKGVKTVNMFLACLPGIYSNDKAHGFLKGSSLPHKHGYINTLILKRFWHIKKGEVFLGKSDLLISVSSHMFKSC